MVSAYICITWYKSTRAVDTKCINKHKGCDFFPIAIHWQSFKWILFLWLCWCSFISVFNLKPVALLARTSFQYLDIKKSDLQVQHPNISD